MPWNDRPHFVRLLFFTTFAFPGGVAIPTPCLNADEVAAVGDDRTDAERIAGANDNVRHQRLAQTAQRFNVRFEKLADRFAELDRRRLESLRRSSTKAASDSLERDWKAARDELNQLDRLRNPVQDQLKPLSEKVQLEHDYLDTSSASIPRRDLRRTLPGE